MVNFSVIFICLHQLKWMWNPHNFVILLSNRMSCLSKSVVFWDCTLLPREWEICGWEDIDFCIKLKEWHWFFHKTWKWCLCICVHQYKYVMRRRDFNFGEKNSKGGHPSLCKNLKRGGGIIFWMDKKTISPTSPICSIVYHQFSLAAQVYTFFSLPDQNYLVDWVSLGLRFHPPLSVLLY